ncbi:MAG: glycoside hydrolase family 127 protein, partial [Bacteroidales bacterium]|nr:glycoside hydrolase family 127 protein [Bacteroidales bacterium]
RKAWYGCACCPSQISRFLPSIGNYIYGVSKDALWVNLYIGNKTDIPVGKNKIEITQKTDYPWNGDIRLVVNPDKNIKKQIRLRIPEWSETYTIRVNGKEVKAPVEKGYAVIDNQWKKGDEILLSLDMKTRVVAADERVKANVGKRAIQRGPLVYCMEETDNKEAYAKAMLTDDVALNGHFDPSLLNGVYVIDATDGNSSFRLIPYYAWDNREAGKMKVWIDYQPK